MRKIGYFLSLSTIVLLFFALVAFEKHTETIKLGSTMPGKDITLVTTNNKKTTLNNFKQENGTLVIFSCNTCPFVIGSSNFEGWEKQYNTIDSIAKAFKIGVVLVNSNTAKRKAGDNLEDMRKRVKLKNYSAHYALDKNNKLADVFGAKTTPHVFLFDAADKLYYEGQIDDSYNPKVKKVTPYLKNALKHMANKTKIKTNKTDAIGCSIKRK